MRRYACATICWKHQLKPCADGHSGRHSKQKEEEGQTCSLEQLEEKRGDLLSTWGLSHHLSEVSGEIICLACTEPRVPSPALQNTKRNWGHDAVHPHSRV